MVWSIRTLLPTCSAAGVHSMVPEGLVNFTARLAGPFDPPGGKVLAGLMQPRRAQQAADVVGPERRTGSAGHLRNSFLAPTGDHDEGTRPARSVQIFSSERT